MQRAGDGKETLVLVVILGGGILAGLASKTLVLLGVVSLLLGVALNAYLLVGLALRTGKRENVPLAAVGSLPAGAYDAVKIFLIGFVAQGIVGLSAEGPGSFSAVLALLHLALLLVTFLLMLNRFLRGAKKALIGTLLGMMDVGLLITCLAVFGWNAALLALLAAFVYGAASRPLAARLAARGFALTGGPSGRYIGLPPRALERISRELDRRPTTEQMMREPLSGSDRHQGAKEALFDYCEANASVREVMDAFKASRDTLSELYSKLLLAGAAQWAGGHYVAASAIAYPHTLRYLLEHPATGREQLFQTTYKLIMHFERGAPLD